MREGTPRNKADIGFTGVRNVIVRCRCVGTPQSSVANGFREPEGDDNDTGARGVSESACVYDGRLSCFPRDTRHSVKSDGKVRQCLCLEVKGGLTGGYSTNPHLISLFH